MNINDYLTLMVTYTESDKNKLGADEKELGIRE